MKTTPDEQRALAFIAALLLLSAAVRVAALPEPLDPPAAAGFDLDGHIAASERAAAERERRSQPLGRGERIDPNTAPEAELDRLPGVGPSLARRIVEARGAGRFRSVSDLTRVPGLGQATAERLAPHLTLAAGPVRMDDAPRRSARARAAGGVGGGRANTAATAAALDINTASAEALTSLPGVGPVLAARIVAYRDSAGPFVTVDSLRAVPGIGPATLARIRPRVRVR